MRRLREQARPLFLVGFGLAFVGAVGVIALDSQILKTVFYVGFGMAVIMRLVGPWPMFRGDVPGTGGGTGSTDGGNGGGNGGD